MIRYKSSGRGDFFTNHIKDTFLIPTDWKMFSQGI